MLELPMAHESARFERDGWMEDNTRGLSLAALAEWDEAAEAFAAAADVLARRAPDASSHDAMALILGNLAQACFRAGRTDDALEHAQRACALRVALTGEDAMPVARQRMDLAVMLGAVGRLDEAQALVQRAIAAVERHVGDDDARLVVMLENAGRLALAAGTPENAEPLLLRLHALLAVHGMSTDRADRLLAMLAAVRAQAKANPDASRGEVTASARASIDDKAALEEWDDQPLRDAVVITDGLLRTTPLGVIVVQEPVPHDAESLAAFETVVDTPVGATLDLVDEWPSAALDIALDLADDVGGPLPADTTPSMALDFTVEHGLAEHGLAEHGLEEHGLAEHGLEEHGLAASHLSAPMLDARTDLMGLELDDALADALVDVPTHRPSREPDHPAPSPLEEPAPAEPPMLQGFGPPPDTLVTPGDRSEPVPLAPTVPRAPMPRAPMARAPVARAPMPRAPMRGQDAPDVARASQPSAARSVRPPLPDRKRKAEGGSVGGGVGLIVGGVAAAVAAGGAVWYFLLG
jgi:tetratricopeptide (TPR) repeat protein